MTRTKYTATKVIELGSCAFRQWRAADNRVNAGNNSDRCSKVHGYRLTAKFWFSCEKLDEKNWSVDSGSLKPLKEKLQHQFDHTLCVAKDDLLLPLFQQLNDQGGCDLRVMDAVGIERTAEYCYNLADEYIKNLTDNRCWVEKVEVWEHENNSAIYEPVLMENVYNCNNIDPKFMVDLSTLTVSDIQQLSMDPSDASIELPTPVAPEPEPTPFIVPKQHDRAAHVGPNRSSGKGDWFKGKSWG